MSTPVTDTGLVSVPPGLEAESRRWSEPLVQAAGTSLRSLYLYGSALRPGFDAEVSDVNLLLVTSELTYDRLEAMARALGRAPASKEHFAPLVLTESQIRTSLDVFPLEFLDLKDKRALLAGHDVLGELEVGRANLRHQCEYELRAKLIGLRQGFLRAAGAEGTAHRLTAGAAGGMAALFRHLLTLHGEAYPDDPEALIARVGEVYGVDAEALAAPLRARAVPPADHAAAASRFAKYMAALEALIAAVDELPPV